jgi:glycosyltransferase involved in cell wall biosynthesis
MRIIYIAKDIYPPRTGGQIILIKLYEYLKQKGHDMVPLSESDIPKKMNNSRILRNLWFLKTLLRVKAEVIFQTDTSASNLFLCNIFLKMLTKSRIVIFIGGFHPYSDSSFVSDIIRKLQIKMFLRFSNGVITLSKFSRDEVLSFSRSLGGKVKVIYPYMQELPNISRELGSRKEMRILYVSNYLPWKGQQYLIEAFSLIDNKNAILVLVGEEWDKNYTRAIRALAEKLGIYERVLFKGRLSGVSLSEAYVTADIFVFPTLYEPFGMVLLEAMYFRMPIIASNTGGIPEIITDGENGLLVNPGDVCSLKIALEKLIGSKELREKIGRKGTGSLKKFPSWEKVCENMAAVVTGENVPM